MPGGCGHSQDGKPGAGKGPALGTTAPSPGCPAGSHENGATPSRAGAPTSQVPPPLPAIVSTGLQTQNSGGQATPGASRYFTKAL